MDPDGEPRDHGAVLIAEEFVLLALTPAGSPARGASYQSGYATGVTGALVTELQLQGHITLDGGRIGVVGSVPEHPLLRQVLENLRPYDGKKLGSKLGMIRQSGWNEVVDAMVDAGVLGRQRPSALQQTRHPVTDLDLHRTVLARVQAAARSDGPLDYRDAALIALAGPCQLLEIVAPERAERKHAKARIAEAARWIPAADAVKRVIDSQNVVVIAAT